ncbi:DUF6207 family protein [Streptomyces sp. NPDC057496]|uniref:DUF6207 family protein n=1 Tax=Streptomyces sp. NPDC057496 TaxID=3346149 RepID=UPI003674700C
MPAAGPWFPSLVRVEPGPSANRLGFLAVAAVMKPIDEQHIAEPGLVVLDITGGDEDTVRAVMAALEERWATSGVGSVRRDPGEPGVRARIYADVLRPGGDGP